MAKRDILTPREERFVDEYMIDLNATAAYVRAFGPHKNADQLGPKMAGKSRVKLEIDRRKAERAKRVGLNADRVLEEWGRIALANMRDFVDIRDGQVLLKNMDDIDPADSACIQEITTTKTTRAKGEEVIETSVTKIKLASKQQALDSTAKHLGILDSSLIRIGGGEKKGGAGPTRVILEWEGGEDSGPKTE